MRHKPRWLIYFLLAALALGGGILLRSLVLQKVNPPATTATVLPTPKALPDFALRDQQDRPFTKASLQGHWSLLFFGYTHCPDLCPTTLAELNRVVQLVVSAQAQRVPLPQVYFISVDPQRDNPASLLKYVSFFNKDFVGATGGQADLMALTRALDTTFFYGEPDHRGNYEVGHSAAIYLLDPQARLRAIYMPPMEPKQIARDYTAIVHYYGGS